MSFPWWGWILLGLVFVVWVLVRAAKSWRRGLRRELVDYFAREVPELAIRSEGERQITVTSAGGEEGTIFLDNLFRHAAQLKGDDVEGRRQLFANLVKAYRERPDELKLDKDRDRSRIRPRLLAQSDVAAMARQTAGKAVPTLETGVPGLAAVVVLDSESSVMYLSREMLKDLDLSAEEALAIATDNLAESVPVELVRRTLDEGALNVVKSFDSYDAARLLVLPRLLGADEQLLALIPDRDTLVLLKVPEQPDAKALRRLARNAAERPLWREPLLVSAAGIAPYEL